MMEGETLKKRLRARRKAMNITLQSEHEPNPNETSIADISSEAHIEENEENDADQTKLLSSLASRREKSRRKLETEEREQASRVSQPQPPLPAPSVGPSQLPTSPRSDGESRSSTPLGRSGQYGTMKSRLREKLLTTKRTHSPSGDDTLRPRRLRDRIDRTSRFSMSHKRHEDEEEQEILKKIQSKLKWKHAMEEARSKRGDPTDDECFDFFTKQYEDIEVQDDNEEPEVVVQQLPGGEETGEAPAQTAEEPEIAEAADTTVQAQSTEQIQEQTEEEAGEQKKLISDIISKELDWQTYNVTAAEYKGYHTQINIEDLSYFVPSKLPPDIRSKVDENVEPRYLEDEGFYVGERPVMLPTNKSILENRLLRQTDRGQGWFGLDGQVESLPNPVKTIQTKPWVESIDELDPSLETVFVKAYSQDLEEKYMGESEENELQIDIGSVNFLHHPLMSREHVLASNIHQMYTEYLEMRRKNYVNFFVEKLAALRNAVKTLKDSPNFSNDSAAGTHETSIHEFMSEIRRTTRQLNNAESTERELMRKIIEEWKEIKSLRELQGYTNTSAKLTVKREAVNQQEDQQNWEEEVRLEVQERHEEYEATITQPYQKSLDKYQEQLREWKRNRQKIKEQRKKDKGSKENLLDPSEQQTSDDEIMIAGNVDKPQKPEKPDPFDEERVKVEVMNSLYEKRRNPGEDKLSLQLTNTTNITPIDSVPPAEATRRKAMLKSAVLLKVRFNGKDVFTTEPKQLTTDFKLNFGSIFRIRIAQWPESLKVQFMEVGLVVNTLFSEVSLNIPDTTIHSGNVQFGINSFTSDRVEAYNHEAVGSNTPFKLRENDVVSVSINTKGHLICSVSWGLNEEGRVLAPKGVVSKDPFSMINQIKSADPVSAIGADGVQNPASLSKWVQETRIDPNDPENATLVPFMQDDQDKFGFLYAPDYFRLEQLQEEFNFLSDEEFNQMNRFRLLRLRHEEVAEFRNMTMIPPQEHEILDSCFTAYERRIRDKNTLTTAGRKLVARGTLSAHRLEVMKYRERVKDAVMYRFYEARHQRVFEDMIHEEQVPDINTLGLSFAKAVEPRRPLKPVRKERKKATPQTLSEGSVKILINVVRGYNIPTRHASHTAGGNHTELAHRFGGVTSHLTVGQMTGLDIQTKTYSVSPFVAISFQDHVVTSNVAQGPNPSWNDELQVPFSAPNNDYSTSSLQTVDDVLFIHLFDRVIDETPPPHGQDNSSVITHKITNHWLGTFRLPFSTVYQRGKIDGTFKLKVPPVLLGYDVDRSADEFQDQVDSRFNKLIMGTFLTLFITLDPTLKPADPARQKFESQEDESVLNLSVTYLADCKKKFPNRNVKTTVVDLKGETVLVTRYVKSIQPPQELISNYETTPFLAAEKIARYVSLIPFSSDNVNFAGICDLWSTCDQFLHMLCGDEEEHAVLLLNYFLSLGKRAYLLLGNAVPEGSTAYVLTFEDTTGEIVIWNSSTGNFYNHNDHLCPLLSVGSLINSENIWFNIQPQELPSRVRFDLTRTSDWKPFFTSRFPNPGTLHSVQPDSLQYVTTDRAYVTKLTQNIKDKLKEKMMSWRSHHVTRWNRSCETTLLRILQELENRYLKFGNAEGDHAADLLNKLGQDVKITGFPMDLPFTNIDAVIAAVRSTEVHKIQDPNIEFALAVYIHPYPGSVLVVWVYIAALVNRRRHQLM